MSFDCIGDRVNLIIADGDQWSSWEEGNSYYTLAVWSDTKGFFFEGEFYSKEFVYKWFEENVPGSDLMTEEEREDYLADRWIFSYEKIYDLYEPSQINEFDYVTSGGEYLHVVVLINND